MRKQRAVEGQQFSDRFRTTTQQQLAAVALRVDFQNDVGELRVADLLLAQIAQIAQAARVLLVGQGGDGWQMPP